LAKVKTSNRTKRDQDRNSGTVWVTFSGIIEALVEKFGWPGMLVAFVMYMIVFQASDEQRHALIDMYLLGRGSIGPIRC
jgi:hypothetical protein